MKKITTALLAAASVVVVSQAASAADLGRPIYKTPAALPVAPMWTWTGLYIGGHLGGAWSNEDVTGAVVPFSLQPSGFLGGAQAGYNWQVNPNWVIGVEG